MVCERRQPGLARLDVRVHGQQLIVAAEKRGDPILVFGAQH